MKHIIAALLFVIPVAVFAQDAKLKGSLETLNQLGIGPKNAVTFGQVSLADATGIAATRSNLGFASGLSNLWTATNAADARTAIGAVASNGTVSNVTGIVAVANGGTGVTNAASFQAVLFPTVSTNSPTNTNAVSDAYLQVTVGTNNYLIPLFGY